MKLKCSYCKATYEIDEKNIDISLEYMSCPVCGQIQLNPFYEK